MSILFIPTKQNQTEKKNDELRACWFSFQEWNENLNNKALDDFKKQTDVITNNLNTMGCNAVFLHIRAFGDAMYQSDIFPPSKYCYGSLNGQLSYDPLQVFIEEAQKKNIEVHGWINPMRTMDDNDFAKISDNYIIKQWYNSQNRSDYFMKDQLGRYILIPSNKEVCDLIMNGVQEVIGKYDVAGIHIDDYFYPTGVENLEQNDVAYYNKVKPDVDIDTWRRDSTSNLIKEFYQTIHNSDKNLVFGVSPQANLNNDYNKMYIDVKKWLSQKGYVDYIMPQIYYGFNNSYLPFEQTALEWSNLIECEDIKYYIGLAGYKLTLENDANAGNGNREWFDVAHGSKDILKRQIEFLKTLKNYGGYSIYSYSSFFDKMGEMKSDTAQEMENINNLYK